jgi:hypothetical protein
MPVKDTIKTTKTQTYEVPLDLAYGTRGELAQWSPRLWKPSPASPQPAHFNVTGETWVPGRRGIESGGCLHELLQEFSARGLLTGRDAILPELVKWHGFSVRTGPTYYIENTLFWYKRHLRNEGRLPPSANPWEREQPGDKNALPHFKACCVFGILPYDTVPELPPFPRQPSVNDHWVYGEKKAEARLNAWRKRCAEVVEEALTPWLNGRLPRLMEIFEGDMVRWFGPEILEESVGG